jgi:hypothetical protein
MENLGVKAEQICLDFIFKTNPHRATMGSIVARWTQPFLPFFLVFSSDSSFSCTVALISSFLQVLGLFPWLLLLI